MGHESRQNPFGKALLIDAHDLTVRDGRGRILHPGDEVIILHAPALYRIHDVSRASGPGIPPGTLVVNVVGTIQMMVARGQAVQEILRVATAEELKPGSLTETKEN